LFHTKKGLHGADTAYTMAAQDLSDNADAIYDEKDMIDHLDEEFELVLEEIESDDDADPSSTFFQSTGGPVSQDIAWQHMSYLADNIVRHAMAQYDPKLFLNDESPLSRSEAYTSSTNVDRWNADTFRGLLLDTGAHGHSTVGLPQAEVYIAEYGGIIDTSRAGEAYVLFGIGSATSISTIDIEAPFRYIIFYIIKIFLLTLFLITLNNIDKHRIHFNNIMNNIIYSNKRI